VAFTRLPDTIPELLRQRAHGSPELAASWHQGASGEWIATPWRELYREVGEARRSFQSLGLAKGDRLGIIAHTRREWQVAELATLSAGAVVVGIDPHTSPEQMQFVLAHAGISCLVVDSTDNLGAAGAEAIAALKFVVVLDPPATQLPAVANLVTWRRLPEIARDSGQDPAEPHPDDPATLIYTAGTTGLSKGIEYSHRKLMAGCKAWFTAYSALAEGDTTLGWLPMAHLYQRMMNLLAMAYGMPLYFAERPQEVLSVIAEARPALFFAVPRFYEKLAQTVRESPASPTAALDIMGGRLKYTVTGAAPVPRWVLDCLRSAGLPLIEAYGVSENTVPVASNLPHDLRAGSVGKPFPTNEVRIAADGEVLVRGPGLFSGYYRDEGSPQCFTPDGFYRTGDLGRFDEDGFLFLEGRKAEIIKTSTGRRISPARIEAIYGESPYLDQVVVFGHGKKALVALIRVKEHALAEALGIAPQEVSGTNREVRDWVRRELESRNERLAPYERVQEFAILEQPLSVAVGELTPTLKLRRNVIGTRYAALIEALYSNDAASRTGGESQP
jgi:long-chain acyl-CoA synthetase